MWSQLFLAERIQRYIRVKYDTFAGLQEIAAVISFGAKSERAEMSANALALPGPNVALRRTGGGTTVYVMICRPAFPLQP
jgi:hypothetical protein